MKFSLLPIALCSLLVSGIVSAQQPAGSPDNQKNSSGPGCPMHDAHAHNNERAEKGMGFSQAATTHHFFLKPSGGVIQVEANDLKDSAARDTVRSHLIHIALSFSNGDFDIPMFVHDAVPPGVPAMKRLREKIAYSFEETANGGRVVIMASDPECLAAIHKFLRFQIAEHHTMDPADVR